MAVLTAQQKLYQLQVEVETDEQWRKDVLRRRGLSVVDVHPDWAGPCLAMRDPLIRLKLLEGGDNLHLFTANANAITPLARFNNHSEPTWMILGSGKLVNLYIGCNCPEIMRLVRSELKRELRALAGKLKRKVLPMKQPTPAEQRRQGRHEAALRGEREEVEAQRRAQVRAVRLKAYRRLAEALRSATVVLFLPHSLDDEGQLPTVAETLQNRWREMGFAVTQTSRLDVTEELAEDIFWERRLPQHRELVESLLAGPCIALLVARQRAEPEAEPDPGARGDAPMQRDEEEEEEEEEELELGQIEHIIAESIYGFYPGSAAGSSQANSSPSEFFSPVGPSTPDLGVLGDQFRLSASSWLRRPSGSPPQPSGHHIFGHEDEHEEGGMWRHGEAAGSPGSQELRPVVDSVAAMLLKRDRVVLPGLWTPLTPLGKAAAVRALFTAYTADMYEEDPVPPPPPTAIVVAFRAYKRGNAWKTIDRFPGEVMHYGFFTEDKKRLATSAQQYEQLRVKEPRDRLVVAVASTRSEPLLALAEVGASYISPNVTIAKRDLEEYFSASVQEAAPRQQHEPSEDEERAQQLEALPGAEPAPPIDPPRVMSVTRVASSISDLERSTGAGGLPDANPSSLVSDENLEMSLISVGRSLTEGLVDVVIQSSETINYEE